MASLALGIAVAIGLSAGVDAELGVRAEGRGTVTTPANEGLHGRAGAVASPTASVTADALPLRVTTTYAARLASSDLQAAPAPLIDHTLALRLETRHSRPWNASAMASAFRGWTDPLADPLLAATTTPGLYGALRPIAYEWLLARTSAEVSLDPLTRLGIGASWLATRASSSEDRALFPARRDAALDASWSRTVTRRDTLRVAAHLGVSSLSLADGDATTTILLATGSWRRSLSPFLAAWVGLGAAAAREGRVTDGGPAMVIPTAEAGFAREGPGITLSWTGSARLTPVVDVISGEATVMGEAAGQLTWRASQLLSIRAGATSRMRLDGSVTTGGVDVRAILAPRERLTLEAGFMGRGQRDHRPEVPSFAETGVVLAVAWRTGPL